MFEALYSVVLPSASTTSTFLPALILPNPLITSILFFFIKNWIPLLIPLATPRLLSITAFIGLVLGYASIKLKTDGDPIIDRIDKILPQTQCGQCGYPGCKPYATAIANGEADINQCPPGGDDGVHKLADLLGVEYKPLNAEHGETKPKSIASL